MNNTMNAAPLASIDLGDGRMLDISAEGVTVRCGGDGVEVPWTHVWVDETETDYTLQLGGHGLFVEKDDMSFSDRDELRRLLLRFNAARYGAPDGRMPR